MRLLLALGLLLTVSLPVRQVRAGECWTEHPGADSTQAHCAIYKPDCDKATCWPDKPFKEQCTISDPNWENTYEGQVFCKACCREAGRVASQFR